MIVGDVYNVNVDRTWRITVNILKAFIMTAKLDLIPHIGEEMFMTLFVALTRFNGAARSHASDLVFNGATLVLR